MTKPTMFTERFVNKVSRALYQNCTTNRGVTRKFIAERLAKDFPGSTEREIVLALTALVPSDTIRGFTVRQGRGGGIVRLPGTLESE